METGERVGELSDWPGCGLTPLRAAAAEAVVANMAWYEEPETRWPGGNTHGADIHGKWRRDAKIVRRDGESVVLCRWGGRPYDTAKVDRIALVEFASATTGWKVREDGSGRGEIVFQVANVWDIPTADLNGLMPDPGNYRNVFVSVDDLSGYLIGPSPRTPRAS